jgi:hypothetical protein
MEVKDFLAARSNVRMVRQQTCCAAVVEVTSGLKSKISATALHYPHYHLRQFEHGVLRFIGGLARFHSARSWETAPSLKNNKESGTDKSFRHIHANGTLWQTGLLTRHSKLDTDRLAGVD